MARYISRRHPTNGVTYTIVGDTLFAYRDGKATGSVYRAGEWDFRDLIRAD